MTGNRLYMCTHMPYVRAVCTRSKVKKRFFIRKCNTIATNGLNQNSRTRQHRSVIPYTSYILSFSHYGTCITYKNDKNLKRVRVRMLVTCRVRVKMLVIVWVRVRMLVMVWVKVRVRYYALYILPKHS